MINKWNDNNVSMYGTFDDSERDAIYPEMLRMADNVQGKSVADYGCGEAQLMRALAEQGAEVWGFDTSDAMVKAAKERVGTYAQIKQIESGIMPVEDNSIDTVLSSLVLMMCPKLQQIEEIHKEVYRVLKPGGAWIYGITHPAFTDQNFTTCKNIFVPEKHYFEVGQPYQFVLINKDGAHVTDESFIDYHYSLENYLNLLPRTGFCFSEMSEVQMQGDKLPRFMVVKGIKVA